MRLEWCKGEKAAVAFNSGAFDAPFVAVRAPIFRLTRRSQKRRVSDSRFAFKVFQRCDHLQLLRPRLSSPISNLASFTPWFAHVSLSIHLSFLTSVALCPQASLHFCGECNNLLYPKADQQRRTMVYACRICTHSEVGDNSCVYRNDLLTVTK